MQSQPGYWPNTELTEMAGGNNKIVVVDNEAVAILPSKHCQTAALETGSPIHSKRSFTQRLQRQNPALEQQRRLTNVHGFTPSQMTTALATWECYLVQNNMSYSSIFAQQMADQGIPWSEPSDQDLTDKMAACDQLRNSVYAYIDPRLP